MIIAMVTNKHGFETFTFYFLNRLVLINLSVEQTDVSMVFEVTAQRRAGSPAVPRRPNLPQF